MGKLESYMKDIINNPKVYSVHINLLNECTCRCKTCRKYNWPDKQLEINKLKQFIEYFKYQGGETIVFSGGEPLLYKDLKELIEYTNSLDLKYSFITSLIDVDIENIKLVADNAERIHVSCDATNAELFERIRGTKQYNQLIENIKLVQSMRRGKIPVRISSTISKLNYKEISNLYVLAKDLGCLINFYLVHTWNVLKMNKEELTFILKLMIHMNHKIATNIIDLELEISRLIDGIKEDKPKECVVQKIHMMLDSNGSVYPCCVLVRDNGDYDYRETHAYGDIYSGKIESIFKRRFKLKYKPEYGCCNECIRYKEVNKEYSEYNKETKLFL